VLYAANLAGRLLASRFARTNTPERLLVVALGLVLAGLPCLLAATSASLAVPGILLAGAGIAALFPLASALHVQASGRTADSALGQTLTVAAGGQIGGPLAVGAIAQASSVRSGLLVLPALTLLAAAGLAAHQRRNPAATSPSERLDRQAFETSAEAACRLGIVDRLESDQQELRARQR
jgi:MFS family permease